MNTSCPPLARSILDVIGRTSLVELTRSVESRGLSGRLLVKLEYFSPGGSKKDRIALEIIREARASGELCPGQTVVELTSGNTGTGLAVVCRAMGHPFVALISRGNSVERVRQMEAFGAEVIIVEQAEGAVDGQVSGEDMALVEEQAAEIVSRRGAAPSASISSGAKATSWPMSGTRGPSSGHNPRDRLTSSWTWSERAARSPGWPGLCAASTPRSERTPSNRPAPRSWAEAA
jgi:hypothetical protein